MKAFWRRLGFEHIHIVSARLRTGAPPASNLRPVESMVEFFGDARSAVTGRRVALLLL